MNAVLRVVACTLSWKVVVSGAEAEALGVHTTAPLMRTATLHDDGKAVFTAKAVDSDSRSSPADVSQHWQVVRKPHHQPRKGHQFDNRFNDDVMHSITVAGHTTSLPLLHKDIGDPKSVRTPRHHHGDFAAATEEPGLLRFGEGTGSTATGRSPSGSRKLDHEMRRRLEIQDAATIALLLVAFSVTVLVSCWSVYDVADDPSPVRFYSDAKGFRERMMYHSADTEGFLEVFNAQPQIAHLRIVGKSMRTQLHASPHPEQAGQMTAEMRFSEALEAYRTRSERNGRRRRRPGQASNGEIVAFDVALDLTPFLTGRGRLRSEDDAAALDSFLRSSNSLEVVKIVKKVEFPEWEDIATNIRQRLRTLGFTGSVEVTFQCKEEVLVYRNDRWQNFVRSRVTQRLVVLSVVGSIIWVPYLWLRAKTTRVQTRFDINIDVERYWHHISEGLDATEGFQGQRVAHLN